LKKARPRPQPAYGTLKIPIFALVVAGCEDLLQLLCGSLQPLLLAHTCLKGFLLSHGLLLLFQLPILFLVTSRCIFGLLQTGSWLEKLPEWKSAGAHSSISLTALGRDTELNLIELN
jgi:hypothetical protein